MINSKKFNNILIISIIGTILLTSIGYSVKNKELMISGDLIFRNQTDIRITDVTLASAPTNAEVLYSDYSTKEINIGYKSLEGTTSSSEAIVTIKVEITNFTDTEMGILKIENLPENATIEGYTLKEKLSNSDGALKAGMGTTFNITLKSSLVEIKELILKVDFEPFVLVTYEGNAFSDTSKLKKEALKGDNFRQEIGENIEICSIVMNEIAISNYTFSNGVIIIPNVNGEIIITGEKKEPVLETPITTPNPPKLNGDMIPVYYDEKAAVWKKADINNTDNNWYDYSTQKWANAVTVIPNVYKENLLGSESVNISNEINEGSYKSTNQGEENTTSNLILSFTTGSSGGTLSFNYKVSSDINDKLEIVVSMDNSIQIVADSVGGQKTGSYTKKISANVKVTIEINYTKNDKVNEYDDTAYISNLSIPTGSTAISNNSKGNYKWLQEAKYYVGTTYGIDSNGKFVLSEITGSDFSTEDIGKYMCAGSMKCTKLYEITSVTGNIIKSVNNYSIEPASREYYVDASVGKTISMDIINTMWVWIPRYSYTIKKEVCSSNNYGKGTYRSEENKIPTKELPGEIDIKFISTSENDDIGSAQYTGSIATNWRTNEAFNFPETDENGHNIKTARAGIWVGKFETTGSYTDICENENCDVSEVTILPNQASITDKSVSNIFYMARSMQKNSNETYGFDKNNGDLHMMKNDEWGAVAYLSQSRYGKYGNNDYMEANKEIYINSSGKDGIEYMKLTTGVSDGNPSKVLARYYLYNDMTNLGSGKGQAGPGASTTGTIYGIYDMSGGSSEYVMGVLEYDEQGSNTHNGQIATGSSGFKGLDNNGNQTGLVDLPNKKYFNTYKKSSSEKYFKTACNGGVCYGHALSETSNELDSYLNRGWYQDYGSFISSGNPWFTRGGVFYDKENWCGIFQFYSGPGYFNSTYSSRDACRLVLV